MSEDRAKLSAAERIKRDARILDLFLAGANYRQIAAAVGLKSHSSVHRIIEREIENSNLRLKLLTDQRVAVFIERTETLFRAHWTAALRGDYKSSVICDRMLARQGRLFGLDIVNGGSLPPTEDPDEPLDGDDEEGGDELAKFRRRRNRSA